MAKKRENVFKRLVKSLKGTEKTEENMVDDFMDSVEDAKYEVVGEETKKTKEERLEDKLDTLLNDLEDKKLSPFQRLVLKAKVDIILGALEREKAKKDYRVAKENYEEHLENAYQEEIEWAEKIRGNLRDEYMEEIYKLNKQIHELERKAEETKTLRFETNQKGIELGLLKPGEEYIPEGEVGLTTAIANINVQIQALRGEQSKIENETKAKQKAAFEERKKQNIEEQERLENAIVEAKPKSLWARFKEGAGKTAENVKGFFTGVSAERAAKKEAKAEGKRKIAEAKEEAKKGVNKAIEDNREKATKDLRHSLRVAPEELTPPPDRSEETAEEKEGPSLREQLADKYRYRTWNERGSYYKDKIEKDMKKHNVSTIEALYEKVMSNKNDPLEAMFVEGDIAAYYATHPEQGIEDGQSQDDDHEGPEQ